ncbi:MAG: phosphate ABC transporter permease subunit PstC [Bacteroidetes bacterium]|nr:phosphate ABC transporter permease subunit PstC [Bacteroidota bacterium]
MAENTRFTAESLKKKFRLSEFLAEKFITGIAFLSITIIVLIFVFVFREAIPLFRTGKAKEVAVKEQVTKINEGLKPESYGDTVNQASPVVVTNKPAPQAYDEDVIRQVENKKALKTLNTATWQPVSDNPRYGLWSLFFGTLKVTLIAILIAAPLGILAALFTSAFAPTWLREILKPAIELLAGFPSVVIGFFALMVMASFFQDLFGYASRLNAFVGGVAMSLAAIPIIYTITEDALSSVPATYKEASLALGANHWQTAFFVTLPAATPGIFASILLGTGRVFGETMIALMATGNAALLSANPFESVRTLAATIGAEMAEVVYGDTHYSVLFLIGALLFIFSFGMNALAEFYIKGRLMKRFMGR